MIGGKEFIHLPWPAIGCKIGKDAQNFAGEGGVTVAKGIGGKAHTSKVADGYTQAGQHEEAIQSMVPSALRQNGGR